MIRIQLPQVEIALMAHCGRAHKDIAADLGIHRAGVTRWLNAYCESGLQGRLRSSI
jgi:transposase